MNSHNKSSISLSSFNDLRSLKGLQLVHLNLCSIVKKIDLFRETVLHNSNINVCCISESWLKPHHDDSFVTMKGYNSFRLDRCRVNAHGSFTHVGGLLKYVRDYLHAVQLDFSVSIKHVEIPLPPTLC